MKFHRSDTCKISQIDGIPLAWHPKNQPDWWKNTYLVPENVVIKLNPMDRLGRVPKGAELPEARI